VTEQTTIRRLTAEEARARMKALSAVLIDCVEGGASVNFLAPLAPERAERFWREAIDSVSAGGRMLFVAEDAATGEVMGTVQIVRASQENAAHRGVLAKLLVHRSARGKGVGAMLMQAAEAAAREAGTTLLVLDTETSSAAERLYARLGWTRVGAIPNYALTPAGAPCATTIFYKAL
jgi:GNAT superfamily N-acetyltransferase